MIGRSVGAGYTILEVIGAGGMGRVYRAEQSTLGKTVAVKLIHPHLAGDESAVGRFYAEARACSRLNHPNTVSVLDFGRTNDGLLFIVMEYLRGRDLSRIVWDAGRLSAVRATEVMMQVLAALAEAHEHGIVHRDVKPENILVEPLRTGGDFAKVVDFGLAKIRTDGLPSVTSPGLVCGTPEFMAPEQCQGEPAEPRSDLYSVGIVLYYCLTGRLPFESEVPAQVLLKQVTEPVPDPRMYVPDLPDKLVAVMMRALSKSPIDRFESAVSFAEALRETLARPALDPLRTPSGVVCTTCSAIIPPGVKFCSNCGAKMGAPKGVREARPQTASRGPQQASDRRPIELPLTGREAERDHLRNAWALAQTVPGVVRLVGDEGVGRHRLLNEFTSELRASGTFVVEVGPDVGWAAIPYDPVARCIRDLLGAGSARLVDWLDARPDVADDDQPVVRVGLAEVSQPGGATDLGAAARTAAVVRALRFAYDHRSASGASSMLIFQRVDRMDDASVRALSAFLSSPTLPPGLVVISHGPRFDGQWAKGDVLTLRGLSHESALEAISAVSALVPTDSIELPEGEILPLHIEQIIAWTDEGGGAPPPRMVDLIAARFARMTPEARRALQALAVLGEASRDMLARVADQACDDGLIALLRRRSWVAMEGTSRRERIEIKHPLLREVIRTGTPAARAEEFHKVCLEMAEHLELPIEVRAMHAEHAGDAFHALLLLERVGDQAASRGDLSAAALAMRRGLELARRELTRGQVDEPEGAIAIFARKLGEVLVRAGEFVEADGVLREGLGVAQRGSAEWVRIEGALGRALLGRGRVAEGRHALDGAVASARRYGQRLVAVELLSARAELEAEGGHHPEAVRLLDEAARLLREQGKATATPPEYQRRLLVDLLLRFARSQRATGEEAAEALASARALVEDLAWPMGRARCEAEGAEQMELRAEFRRAVSAWRRAVGEARKAGDVVLAEACAERAARIGRTHAPIQAD